VPSIRFSERENIFMTSEKEEGRAGWERGPGVEVWVAEIQFNNSFNPRRFGAFFS
jgi:hypothetical protein